MDNTSTLADLLRKYAAALRAAGAAPSTAKAPAAGLPTGTEKQNLGTPRVIPNPVATYAPPQKKVTA